MENFLKAAALAWAKTTLNIQKFADSYVAALLPFGDEARERFALAYPMFGPREWRRMELVGNRELLPQFMFKSDSFVGKLLKFPNSMKYQKALISASNDGFLRIDRGNGPESVPLSRLTRDDEKAVMLLMNETDANLKPSELRAKFRSMVLRVNKRNAARSLPKWEIREIDGIPVARFNRPCTVGRHELVDIFSKLTHAPRSLNKIAGATELLKEMAYAIVDLESLRDEEWDFEEEHGPSRECWTGKDVRTHRRLLDRIQKCRFRVRNLVREATGDKNLEV